MRWLRRGLILLTILVALVAIVWGPRYFSGLSLVVRAAHLDGWLKRAADIDARRWTAGPATTIPTRHGAIPARIYRPEGRIRRAAILTPGVHAMGIDEPRLRGLAGDLAASGVTVVTIALPDLVRYRFTPQSVDEIEDAGLWLAGQRELAPDGKAGLMGISFAGGLSVVAAGRPALRDKVAYVFSFGGHGDLARVLRYLCTGLEPLAPGQPSGSRPHVRAPHDYGVAVILLGLADRIVPVDQVGPLRRGLETFLTASQLTLVDMSQAQATFKESQAIAATLPEPSGHLMRYVNERNTKALGAELLPVLERIGAEEYPPSLSAEHSPAPSAPVYLLHGTDDTVIPAVETRLLAAHLESEGADVHALLSGLITHAEVDKSAAAAETWRLVGFWARLLSE
jgi:dienelactone hydrolase